MNYNTITTFVSKRNRVCLAESHTQQDLPPCRVVIKDFGQNIDSYHQELKISRTLYDHGVSVPGILEVTEDSIVYKYLEGTVAVDLLEQLEVHSDSAEILAVFDGICHWLKSCYDALEDAFSCEMILGDAHLRNFIYSDKVYGVDFECVTEGHRETDVANLAVFTVTYSPMCTPAKYKLAAFICKRCMELMELDSSLLRREMSTQLAIISNRRKIILPSEIVPSIWAIIEHERL
ncbi:MAG: hypothetical protein RSD07_07700 [Angelakisella sp.]